LALLCLGATLLPAQGKPWWGDVVRGGKRYVGFTTQVLRDPSRADSAEHPRWIQLGIWYPALVPGRTPITYADYLRVAAAETTVVDTATRGQKNVDAYRALLTSRGVPDNTIGSWLNAPMQAYRDVPFGSGFFPLVVVAQGNGESAVDQAVLAEYLASYGYVVVTSPSQSRISGKPTSDGDVAAAIEDQLADVTLVHDRGRKRHDVRDGRVALIAHSFGARSALLFAMREPTVRAVVSLDGGIGTATARESFEGLEEFLPDRHIPPVLHIYEELDPQMTPDWGTLKRLSATQVWLAKTADMHHHHFTSLGAAAARYPELGKATGAAAQTGPQYAAMIELTRAFLDLTMRDDSTAWKRLSGTPGGLHPEPLPR
jgi:dienelactone hydrolase